MLSSSRFDHYMAVNDLLLTLLKLGVVSVNDWVVVDVIKYVHRRRASISRMLRQHKQLDHQD
jgi:hypothetical protein